MKLGRLFGPPILLAASVLFTLLVSEGCFTLLLVHPQLLRALPDNTLAHLRHYYLAHDRNMIQAMPECARFDAGLFYTLKPGRFRFRNREFDNEFRVNHLGLRDDEASLRAPAVIVVGDSYAMGWGIDEEETIAKTIERRTGLRSLNGGIASYGTVREIRLLDRLDTSALKYLVIQYDDDDVLENRPFTNHDNKFSVGDEAQYGRDVERAERRKRYYFGRRTFEILKGILSPEPLHEPAPATAADQARYFVNVLLHAGRTDLSRVRIIVLEVSLSRRIEEAFPLALEREVSSPAYPHHIRSMDILDLAGKLKPEHYYELDDHLRSSGQAVVADLVVQVIRSGGGRP